MSNNPTNFDEWNNLKKFAQNNLVLNDLFDQNPDRAKEFSVEIDGLFFDYSKQRITKDAISELISLLDKNNFQAKRDAMFEGEKINITEGRAVLHTALRAPKSATVEVNGKNIIPEIHTTLDRIEKLSNQIRNGDYKGATHKNITDVVSIGIGGSDLGPRMVYEALNDHNQPIKTHFVSNIDADDLLSTLQICNPETTLFIVISKSFSTQETLQNALSARHWVGQEITGDISKHFICVSANVDKAVEFGIAEDNIYPMWEWVNGRFSLWSAVGLPLAIGLGFENFRSLLDGAYEIDEHFKTAPFDKNIPVLMALIGVWNRNFLDFSCHAVLPYAEKLSLYTAYLQQLEMESNGKQTDLEGKNITDYKTGPTLFGEAGTNGQHSFYQLLHQGSDIIPCDFIGAINSTHEHDDHSEILTAHMLAQGQAMMQGKSDSEDRHGYFEGNRPSLTLLIEKLDAYHLGMLIALYEHKVLVQGHIWNINSFDQFGVELGKKMANNILNEDFSALDSSTKGLYSRIYSKNK